MKKKLYRLILFAVLMMCCTVMNAQNFNATTRIEYESGKFMYFILDEASHTATVTWYQDESYNSTKEYTGDIQVPDTVTYDNATYNVTGIGASAFSGCIGLTSISLQEGVKTIGNDAFYGCSNIESELIIPSTVTTIENNAFYGCEKIPSVSINGGSIGGSAFWNCISLTSISLQEGVTNIGEYAFSNCFGIEKAVVIPSTVMTIGNDAFYGCEKIDSVTIKGGSIGSSAFWNCTGLTSISLQEGVTSIGSGAFTTCSGLEGDLVIPSTVTSIGATAFKGLTKLSSVTVKSGNIGDFAFSDCTGLTSISLQEGVTGIGMFAFSGCSNIEGKLIIPSTMTSIGNDAFYGCEKIDSVTVKGGSIGNNAFSGCTGLTSISLQEGVTSIGFEAFNTCSRLEGALVIPSTVTSIGTSAFNGCVGFTSISLLEGVTSIGNAAFGDCSGVNENLNIPSTVTSIGQYAFAGCTNLPSIYIFASIPPTLGDYAFNDVNKGIPVYVPNDEVYAGWGEFTNIKLINYFKFNGETHLLDEEGKTDKLEFVDKNEYLSYRNFIVENLTYSRTFTNTNWQALYVPFAISYFEWEKYFDVATINNFHEYTDLDGNTIKTELEVRLVKNGTLKPNHPYLIKAKKESANSLPIIINTRDVCQSDVNSIVCSSVENKYTFTGTYKEIADLKTNDYIFMSGGKLCKATNDDVTLSPQRWYLKIEPLGKQVDNVSDVGVKATQFDIKLLDDEPTGIDEITVTRTPLHNNSDAPYNLKGIRANNSYENILIKDRKKFYQK